MDIEKFRSYCLSKTETYEDFPFGPETLVFKTSGKMFSLVGLENKPFQVSLKCDPEWSLELREVYPEIIQGAYHMNKKHWNQVLPELLPDKLVCQMIDHSYALVREKLPGKKKKKDHE